MSEGILTLRLFVRVMLALFVALAISSALWLTSGLSLPIHGANPPGFLWNSTSSRVKHRVPISRARPTGKAGESQKLFAVTPIDLSAATTVLAYPRPPVQARAAILVNMNTGRILYNLNPDARLPMASTTKITTAIVTLGHAKPTDLAVASENAVKVGESTMVLHKGERLTIHQLLYGLMLNSANDAAVALAEHVAGTQQRFVKMMNRLAHRLGMTNTHYVSPHGLDAKDHYSSARDLATISRFAMENRLFREIVSTWNYHIASSSHNKEHWLANINRVLFWYPGADGVKPGDTDNAGLCQVVTVHRDGKHLLAVLLHTPTLTIDIRNLLDYGLRDFRWVPGFYGTAGPSDSLQGGSASHRWDYYFGAGHYIRGLFLSYFNSHGGLLTLGYPRTEQILDGGNQVQYFQGGELIYDAVHHNVYPADLGASEATHYASTSPFGKPSVDPKFKKLYRQAGGSGVLGGPVTGLVQEYRNRVQFFQYGELALEGGRQFVVPIGDAGLRRKGWLPAIGAADAYPSSMAPEVIANISEPHPATRPINFRHVLHWIDGTSSKITRLTG